MNTASTFTTGQTSSDGVFRIIAIENGKACVADNSPQPHRYEATRRWYKLESRILAAKMAR